MAHFPLLLGFCGGRWRMQYFGMWLGRSWLVLFCWKALMGVKVGEASWVWTLQTQAGPATNTYDQNCSCFGTFGGNKVFASCPLKAISVVLHSAFRHVREAAVRAAHCEHGQPQLWAQSAQHTEDAEQRGAWCLPLWVGYGWRMFPVMINPRSVLFRLACSAVLSYWGSGTWGLIIKAYILMEGEIFSLHKSCLVLSSPLLFLQSRMPAK